MLTLATTTMVTRISSEAKTALQNYFIDLIEATMAQPATTTAATASSTALATTTTTLATTTTATRISSEAKTALRNYFIEHKWPLNKNLPRGREMEDILGTLCLGGLSHAQIARQLLNYKKDVFGMQRAVNNMSSIELEAKFRSRMGMSTSDFVTQTLTRLGRPGDPAFGKDFNNLARAIPHMSPFVVTYVQLIADSPDQPNHSLFVSVVDSWIVGMAVLLPKTISGVQGAQVQFDRKREALLPDFVTKFRSDFASSGVGENITEVQFAYLGRFLYTAVCNEWLKLISNIAKPPMEYPLDCLVGKHALKVIYYVAGWTLYSASKALTKGIADRPLFQEFAQSQTIDADTAKGLGLPTSLVDMRKRSVSRYCTSEYFEFICFVESVFLANLSLEMMLAYPDGTIIAEIKHSILSSEEGKVKFVTLVGNNVDELDRKSLMEYVLERYANMRGTYFVRHLKGNRSNHIQTMADSQATRTRVLNATVCAKKLADKNAVTPVKDNDDEDSDDDNLPEIKEFWDSAKENVFKLADEYEDSNINE
jgi:hypothetical protein